MDERALAELRTLAERDGELQAAAARLRELDAGVGAIRARAAAIAAFFVAYTDEESRRRAETREAEAELARRRRELADAEAQAAQARDDEARARAARAVARAEDHVEVAAARLARAEDAEAELETESGALERELPELDARARTVPDVPAPAGDLVDWASRAHAELFVAAGQLDVQRERLIREANELASMLLGEPTYGSTPAQALARFGNRSTA